MCFLVVLNPTSLARFKPSSIIAYPLPNLSRYKSINGLITQPPTHSPNPPLTLTTKTAILHSYSTTEHYDQQQRCIDKSYRHVLITRFSVDKYMTYIKDFMILGLSREISHNDEEVWVVNGLNPSVCYDGQVRITEWRSGHGSIKTWP